MYAPPALGGADLPALMRFAGGRDATRRLLEVSDRTLRRWQSTESAPAMALRLLWYASEFGRAAAEFDLAYALTLAVGERDALRRELQQTRQPLVRPGNTELAVRAEFARL